MTEFERAECKAYLEKQIKRLSINLVYANSHKNSENEQAGIMRKLKIHRNLLELLEPTMYGYRLDDLMLVAALLKQRNITPDDIKDLKCNFQRALDLLRAEQDAQYKAAIDRMLQDLDAGLSGRGLDFCPETREEAQK